MYHPSRGGVRGGRDQFNWEDVKADKHRENYIGHSLKAPVGRWQKGKDLHWYTKDKKSAMLASEIAKEEIERIKLEEEQAMREALGLAPKHSTRPSGSHLDKQEVAELLKRGNGTEDQADTYAIGERVQGLGFTPAPGGKGNKKIPVQIKSEAESTLIQLDSLAGVGNPRESAKPENADVVKLPMVESDEVSRRMKKEERRAAREARRQEKNAKKLARKEEKANHQKKERDRLSKKSKRESVDSDDQLRRRTATTYHSRWHKDGSSSYSSDEAKEEKSTHRSGGVPSQVAVSGKTSEYYSPLKRRRRHDSDSDDGDRRLLDSDKYRRK
ncbi:hypothetical protein O6H91_23G034100 [Diphasiastrum complanatum]|uniref:Uncharacterized protein n=1 Tax=Diphasiastrum complanatum TaxID=34168 RepID=A0ACC2A9K6_DIPCM|nr:hypothetical protein O6H91_23G034100 [Diphasiastrum complanatum]